MDINPVLFHIGNLEIRYYGILMALAFLVGYFILRKLAKEKNISEDLIDTYFLYLLPSILIGARLFEILFYEPGYYFASPLRMLYIWQGGIASHGGIIAGIAVTYFFAKKHKIHFYKLADLVVIPCALGAAFIRIGNFTNSELVGKLSNLPWAVSFKNYLGLRHPVQIYEAITNTLLFFSLFLLRKKNLKEGTLFWSFILVYSLVRFFIEFFKEINVYLRLTIAQWSSIPLVIISLVFLYKIKKK